MKRFLSATAAALALLLMTGMGVQANPLPSNLSWTYNFTPGAASLSATTGTGSLSFTNQATATAIGNSTIVGTNIRDASTASASTPDTISGSQGHYTLALALATTDDTGLHQATLTFSGQLSGSFSLNSSNIGNVFGPNATQSVTLGAYTFTVALNSFTPPGPPGQTNAGSIAANVTITPASNPVTTSTPEPGTMVLAGLGLSFFGGAAWRKRRQARLAVSV